MPRKKPQAQQEKQQHEGVDKETATNEQAQSAVAVEKAEDEAAPKDAPHLPPKRVVLIRTGSVGNHIGVLEKHEGDTVVLRNARRLWEHGSQSLDHLAEHGPVNPEHIKLMAAEDKVILKAKTLNDPKQHDIYDLSERAVLALGNHPAHTHSKKAVSA